MNDDAYLDCSAVPVPASHSLTVLSPEADANCLPSGEKATAMTQPEWPSIVQTTYSLTMPDPVDAL